MAALSIVLLLGAVANLLHPVPACVLSHQDSGTCTPVNELPSQIPFCSSVVKYTACLPRTVEPWTNHTAAAKDQWVASSVRSVISTRIAIENNLTYLQRGVNENGIIGDIAQRFTDDEDCQDAYRNFACFLNFPRCDGELKSMTLCRSVCENFFIACNYPEDLWRCGNPVFFGADEPEEETDIDENGLPIFWRAPFPGLPFTANRFDGDGNPLEACTPSIAGSAATSHTAALAALLAAAAALANMLV